MFARSLLFLALALQGCAATAPQKPVAGRFEGSLLVMWVGEGGSSGSGKFVYVPSPTRPLTFTRGTVPGRPPPERAVIRPAMMYTDGGSIPALAQVFKGFNPWGYAPAYMMHDWLFQAHRCNRDSQANKAEIPMAGMTFEESADVLAEAIETLVRQNKVKRNDVAQTLIPEAVRGSNSRRLWNGGSCPDPRVSDADSGAATGTVPGSSAALPPDGRVLSGKVVAEIAF